MIFIYAQKVFLTKMMMTMMMTMMMVQPIALMTMMTFGMTKIHLRKSRVS